MYARTSDSKVRGRTIGKSDSRSIEGIVERHRTGWKSRREEIRIVKRRIKKGCRQGEGARSVGRKGEPVLEIRLKSTDRRVDSSQESTVFCCLSVCSDCR